MMTLDDVIEAMERCSIPHYFDCKGCPYEDDDAEVGCRSDDKERDALHYLKLFQADCERVRGQLEDLKQEYRPNDPLTWDELKAMEGKPVWVEALLYKQWAVIAYVGDEYVRFEGANLYAPESKIYMGEEDGWQAYRKERE